MTLHAKLIAAVFFLASSMARAEIIPEKDLSTTGLVMPLLIKQQLCNSTSTWTSLPGATAGYNTAVFQVVLDDPDDSETEMTFRVDASINEVDYSTLLPCSFTGGKCKLQHPGEYVYDLTAAGAKKSFIFEVDVSAYNRIRVIGRCTGVGDAADKWNLFGRLSAQ